MNSLHEHPVDSRLGLSPPPHSSRGNEQPESPPPVGVQAANLPFDLALRCFQAQHGHVVNRRAASIETMLFIDMRREAARQKRARVVVKVMRNGMEFLVWASMKRRDITIADVLRRFPVSRATGYRWLHAYQEARGAS